MGNGIIMNGKKHFSFSNRRLSIFSFGVLAFILIAAGSLYWFKKKSISHFDGPPGKTAEQILKEREEKAALQLTTPLGNVFATRNWDEFSKSYRPERDFLVLAELIRSTFIQNGFRAYRESDHERLMEIALQTLSGLNSNMILSASTLFFQVERLPAPNRNSKNYRALEKWLEEPRAHARLKKLALIKLVVNAENPDSKWVSFLNQGIEGNPMGVEFQDSLNMITETRNVKVRQKMIQHLFHSYSKLGTDQRPDALVVMSSYPEIDTKLIKASIFKFLNSKKPREFESALRATDKLLKKKLLNAEEKAQIKERFSQVPMELNTPYVSTKISEILKEFEGAAQ